MNIFVQLRSALHFIKLRLRSTKFLFALFFLTATQLTLAESLDYIAFSMKEAQVRLEEAALKGGDFRKSDPLLHYLGGITKPAFVVLDANSGDWILVGQKEANGQPLTLDDWVVALRAAFLHRTSEPGVTIDPVPCEKCIREGKAPSCKHLKEMKVRFFGGIDGSVFGRVCFDADWLLKRIGGGFDDSPISSVRSYFGLLSDDIRKSGENNVAINTRFWFYPIVNRVNVLKDLVLLEKLQMGVFTEVMSAEVGGKQIKKPQDYQNTAAETFARLFSENYDALADRVQVLERLRGLTRFAALAKGVSQLDQVPDTQYFLASYVVPKVFIPAKKEPITNRNERVGIQFTGGVELMSLTMRLKAGDATALRDVVLRGRSNHALAWSFSVAVENGRPAGLNIPIASDASELAILMSQGWFLYQKQRFEAAVECFERVSKATSVEMEDVLWAKGVALREWGVSSAVRSNDSDAVSQKRVTDAIALFRRIIELNPKYAPAHYQLGATLNGFGDYDAAVMALEQAVQLSPMYAEAHYTLANALKSKGNLPRSMAELERAIQLDKEQTLPQDAVVELNSLKAKLAKSGASVGSVERKLKSYHDERRGFTFKYPDDWQVLSAAQMAAKSKGMMAGTGSDIILTVANPDDWDQNLILKMPNGRMGGDFTAEQIEEFASTLDRGMARTYEGFKKLPHRIVKINGASALEYNMESTRLGVTFQTKEVVFSKGGQAFIIVCTGKQSVFDKLDKTYFQPILQNFTAK